MATFRTPPSHLVRSHCYVHVDATRYLGQQAVDARIRQRVSQVFLGSKSCFTQQLALEKADAGFRRTRELHLRRRACGAVGNKQPEYANFLFC